MTDLDDRTDLLSDPERLGAVEDAARALLFHDARTANTWSPAPVTDDELRGIWDMARWAPTSANVQPLRVLYVRTEAGKARLVPHMSEGNRARTASAPVVAVLAEDTRFHEHIPAVMPPLAHMQGVLEADEALRARMGSFSTAMQAGYFVLAVRAAGLAAGPMAGFDASGLDAEFFTDGRWHATLVVNIGHPGPEAFRPRMPRLDPAEVLRWE